MGSQRDAARLQDVDHTRDSFVLGLAEGVVPVLEIVGGYDIGHTLNMTSSAYYVKCMKSRQKSHFHAGKPRANTDRPVRVQARLSRFRTFARARASISATEFRPPGMPSNSATTSRV